MNQKIKVAILPALYFAWSCFVYFGSLGSEAHSWWPVFLMPISLLIDFTQNYWLMPILRLFAAPGTDRFYLLYDRAFGAACILVGSVLFWILSRYIFRWGFKARRRESN